MNIILLNILYWLTSTLELILMKILVKYFSIENMIFDVLEIFNIFIRSIYIPYFIWKIFDLYKQGKNFNPRWIDILTGFLDQFDIFLYYIALSGLTFGEYITYRTFSIFITGLLLFVHNRNILSMKKCISYLLIFCACLILLISNNTQSNVKYIVACLTSSIFYSCINILVELNVKSNSDAILNICWTKIISNIIGGFVGLAYENNTHLISFIVGSSNGVYISIGSILIGLCANLYYWFKINIILQEKSSNSGSMRIIFLDIIRRCTIFIIGILFFNEIYNNITYMAFGLMFIGSIFGFIKFTNCTCINTNERFANPNPSINVLVDDHLNDHLDNNNDNHMDEHIDEHKILLPNPNPNIYEICTIDENKPLKTNL
jgi:hypothetical protein